MAVTAFPVILVDNAGSDTAASGAGPSTALTGAAGVTSADGLTVVLDGSPDLTNVATDGSHVLFMSDTNAGSRNFCAINGKGDSGTATAFVTVEQAFQGTNTDAWAIGGMRDTIGGTTSLKMFSNNSAAGDAMPGWAVQMQSGYTETLAATYNIRRSGDQTSGLIELRGLDGAATKPIITFSNNGVGFLNAVNVSYFRYRKFSINNSHGTKTLSEAIRLSSTTLNLTADEITIAGAAGSLNFWKGITIVATASAGHGMIANCDIRNTASHGIEINLTQTNGAPTVTLNYVRDAGGSGIHITAANRGAAVLFNTIYSCTGDGIGTTAAATQESLVIVGNTVDDCDGDGIDIAADLEVRQGMMLANNLISNNTGFGINWNSATAAAVVGSGAYVIGNAYYNNTAGDSSDYLGIAYTQAVDPAYTNASGDDFSIGTGLKAKGWPTGGSKFLGGSSATYSYVDPGAAQRQEAGGSSTAGMLVHPGMSGGMRG